MKKIFNLLLVTALPNTAAFASAPFALITLLFMMLYVKN